MNQACCYGTWVCSMRWLSPQHPPLSACWSQVLSALAALALLPPCPALRTAGQAVLPGEPAGQRVSEGHRAPWPPRKRGHRLSMIPALGREYPEVSADTCTCCWISGSWQEEASFGVAGAVRICLLEPLSLRVFWMSCQALTRLVFAGEMGAGGRDQIGRRHCSMSQTLP